MFREVCPLEVLKPESISRFQVAEEDVLLCRVGDEVFAVENKCSHMEVMLDGGKLQSYELCCPSHGARFDVRTGQHLSAPAVCGIRSYAVRVEGAKVFVAIDD